MKRTLVAKDIAEFPSEIYSFINGADIYDSSCSDTAKVYFADKDCGYYIKSSSHSLKKEAELGVWFNKKGLAPQVLEYFSRDGKDWLVTQKARGEDCTHPVYLEDPKRLCDTTAQILRALHEIDFSGCPVTDRMTEYISLAEKNHNAGLYDLSLLSGEWSYSTSDAAWQTVQSGKHLLKNEVLLHGDYCLPNIMLDNWKFSSFIDLGNGGVGDRHVDIFWGIWTLFFNLGTHAHTDRFLDAYGRDKADKEKLRLIAAFEIFG